MTAADWLHVMSTLQSATKTQESRWINTGLNDSLFASRFNIVVKSLKCFKYGFHSYFTQSFPMFFNTWSALVSHVSRCP